MKVYLCGPINGCTDSECIDWRAAAKKRLSDTIDPMRRDYRGREAARFPPNSAPQQTGDGKMTDINTVFCRRLLSELQAEPTFRASRKHLFKDGWVWTGDRRHWEFHGPDSFYWHGRAENAYDARYKGWSAWIDHQSTP
jgi:hypothetical protein